MRTDCFAALLLAALCAACPSGEDGSLPDGGQALDAQGANSQLTCSADLREVLTSEGAAVAECGGDEGCSNGECIAACDAAAASAGNIGCDFKAAVPHFYTGYPSPCFAVFVANTWPTEAQLQVSRGGQVYDLSTFGRIATDGLPESAWPAIPATGLPAGKVGVLFLSESPTTSFSCPVAAALEDNTAAVAGSGLASYGTTIDMVPGVDLPAAGTIPVTAANTPLSFTLNAGEYVQWQLATGLDLTGSVIASDKPITFVGGDAYICYSSATSESGGCDSAHQQVPPISAFGSEYVAAPHPNRGAMPESIWYRFVGAVDGTSLTFDPPIPGGPASIAQGQTIDFQATGSFRVESQDADHAFYVAQTMAGCMFPDNPGCRGDEDYVMVLPAAQYLSRYVFFSDTSYQTTELVFVREKVDGSFSDVDLACMGTITGWTPVGTSGEFEMAQVAIVEEGVSVGGCVNGRHETSSAATFPPSTRSLSIQLIELASRVWAKHSANVAWSGRRQNNPHMAKLCTHSCRPNNGPLVSRFSPYEAA